MATVKVQYRPKLADSITLAVEIEVSGRELAADRQGVIYSIMREIDQALARGNKG